MVNKLRGLRFFLILSIVIFGMAFFVSVRADNPINNLKTNSQEINGQLFVSPTQVDGTIDCMDYYRSTSVQINIALENVSVAAGSPAMFKGTIKNDNNYPIVDGAVYVKIFRKQVDQKKAQINGNNLVDQFFVQDSISLNAKEEKGISFNWSVPNYALSGEYQIATFFTSAKKFNLAGLSFTDDIIGGIYNFKVKSEKKYNVELDKNSVDVNGQKYHTTPFPPRFKDGDIIVKTNLINSSKELQSIPITWTLYFWDGQQEQNIIDTKKETIELKPNETKNIQYVIQNKEYPVYYLVAEADYEDAKSIIDVRVARQDVNRTQISFSTITNYPLKQNEKNTLFVCVRNSGIGDAVDNNKLVLTLLDENKQEIHKYIYTGQISNNAAGLLSDFMPNQDYDNFTLKSELYTDNKLVDSVEMNYDCHNIDTKICSAKSNVALPPIVTESGNEQTPQPHKILVIAIVIAGVLLIISLSSIIIVKRKNSGLNLLVLGFVVALSLLFGGAGKVQAMNSVVWNTTVNSWFYYYNGSLPSNIRWSSWGFMNPNFSVRYKAKIINVNTGLEALDGSNILVGDTIRFETQPFDNTDIYWFTGSSWASGGTPYGHWINSSNPPAVSCDSSDYTGDLHATGSNFTGDIYYHEYSPLLISPATVTIEHTGSTAGLTCDAQGIVCMVDSPGTIVASFTYGTTFGKIYHRYSADCSGAIFLYGPPYPECSSCVGDNTPMRASGQYTYPDPGADYVLSVPAQVINYNLTAVPLAPCPLPWDNTITINDGDGKSASKEQQACACSAPIYRTCHNGTLDGSDDYKYETCAPIPPTPGECGSANGQFFTTQPTENLCEFSPESLPTAVGSNPWTWTCSGVCSPVSSPLCSASRDLNWREAAPN